MSGRANRVPSRSKIMGRLPLSTFIRKAPFARDAFAGGWDFPDPVPGHPAVGPTISKPAGISSLRPTDGSNEDSGEANHRA